MAVVYYKFKSSKDFHSIPVDGPFISVSEFKSRIFASKRYGNGKDFDLLITNAKTDEQYADDSILIPTQTSLLIRRIPGVPVSPIVIGEEKPKIEKNPSSVVKDPHEEGRFDCHDFGPDSHSILINSTANPSNTHCKEDKIYDGFKTLYVFGKGRIPPQGYVCHRCKMAGHYIQHCPTNGNPNYDFKRVKPTTANSKASASSSGSSFGDNMIPLELRCLLCKKVMKDAALTKCCFRSFCDRCIRDHIVSKSACVCQRKIVAGDILPNATLRDTINRILYQSGNRNSYNGGTSFSIQESASAASKADQQTQMIVPPQHTSDKVKEPTSKGSVLLAEKQEQQKKVVSGKTQKKRKRKVSMMPRYPQWRTSQNVGVDSYMMPPHHSAYNQYWAGMYPGFMSPYAAVMPQNQMFTAFPPEKNPAEFGLDADFAQPTKKYKV
ncbi:PREDICTED: uncharacterized RING finger protein P8B7.15c [Theobroma cacao]|uniref:Uncharacterized RING finger protein P8B7.15c n=1 Tax=Theobroma cacao TaxID=3641 RepID=A0AB32UYW7_THECC|nr:PREDICTED: uncharacterized RING finger protein P8B7.15c [Theobroma cacao]